MKILFVVTGSIAVKKCNEIFKKLTLNQIQIDCIITDNAKKMINLNSLQKNITGKIYTNRSEKKNRMLHIELTRKTDLMVICPATANIIAKLANGYADDLASTSLIASNKQIIVIPAMNSEMWNNSINKKNVRKLKEIGVEFIGPENGLLSCGEKGLGRLSEPNKIIKILMRNLHKSQIFRNKRCLVTAGPTIEPIDTIRYLSNYSSGKQGYEIAKQLVLSGAKVTLVSGPTNLQPPFNSKLIKINTAKEMLKVVKDNSKVDIAIFTAAVSDASPNKTFLKKIKKENLKNITLKKNKDILYEISTLKKNRPKLVIGFATETNNHIINARKKLLEKKCDAIIVNKIGKKNQVFNSEMNKVSFISEKLTLHFKKTSKINVAKKILGLINKIEK